MNSMVCDPGYPLAVLSPSSVDRGHCAARARMFTPWACQASRCGLTHCIDGSTPEMAHAGIAGYPLFMSQAERMVTLVSPGYWGRLRCVYELALLPHACCRSGCAALLLSPNGLTRPRKTPAGTLERDAGEVQADWDSPNERGGPPLPYGRMGCGTFDSFIRSRGRKFTEEQTSLPQALHVDS